MLSRISVCKTRGLLDCITDALVLSQGPSMQWHSLIEQ